MIERYNFGKILIQSQPYTHDLLIVNGKVHADWRRRKGHRVEPEDLALVLAAEPDIIVLGKGKPGLMRATSETKDVLREKGIVLIEEKTAAAITTFNRLFTEGKKVAAGFHLTC